MKSLVFVLIFIFTTVVVTRGQTTTENATTLVTSDQYSYVALEHLEKKLKQGQTSFVFLVRATNDAHLALHQHAGNTDQDMYEIVIGGWRNTKSVIRNQKQGTNFASVNHNPLSAQHYRYFWVSWENGLVKVGSGRDIRRNQFMAWSDPSPHTVNYISVSTGWGSTGNWRFVEATALHTPDLYRYHSLEQYGLKLAQGVTTFAFQVRARNDAHIALHQYYGDTNQRMYEIVIGGWGNSQSVIRNQKQGTNFASAPNQRLSVHEYRDFWVSWKSGVVAVGSGKIPGRNQFMAWSDPSPHTVNYISVSTGWGATGDWWFGETTAVYTPDLYQYESVEKYGVDLRPEQTSFTFLARAKNDVHLALHSYRGDTDQEMYEIVIGGWGNRKSVIRERKQGTNLASVNHMPLSEQEYRYFWISWRNGVVAVGSGNIVGRNRFMTWTDTTPHDVNYISVSTGWGATGEWQFDTKSELYTPNNYKYVPWKTTGLQVRPRQTTFVFEVKAKNDVHLALHQNRGDTDQEMYEIVIGGWGNRKSVIRERKQGTNLASVNHIPLSEQEYRYFWISWMNGVVAVGSGNIVGRNRFMTWTDTTPHDVNYISVSTGWGATGEWRFDTL